jgi:hypothetical protein
MIRILVASVLGVALLDCRSARPAPQQVTPRIVSLAPDSVAVLRGPLVEVVIRGEGFEVGGNPGNTVQIGPVLLQGVPANDSGTVIRVVIPHEYSSGREAPPHRMMPGRYDVTVRTRAGTSNVVKVKVVE